MDNTVAFDPGFGQILTNFNDFINEVYSQLMNFQSISQKRSRFRLLNNKIFSELENNIAFYQGCLLWAYFIKKNNEAKPKQIEGNLFLSIPSEQIKDYDYMLDVNFIENYFDSYERDTLYYLGKQISINEQWKQILEIYKEFLELNKGFINTKTTDDIKLPKKLNNKKFNKDIEKLINKSINDGDLKILLSVII